MELETTINARSRRDHLDRWYGRLLKAASRAGVSVAELARRVDCSPETIYAWRRRLATAGPVSIAEHAPGLLRVQLAPAGDPDPGVGPDHLEVRLRSGRSVLVPAAFDRNALAAIVEVLEGC